LLSAALLCLAGSGYAQTPVLKFGFEDTGTTTVDSMNAVSLNISNATPAATDLHGVAGTGVAGVGKALNFTSAPSATGSAAPIANTVNNATLAVGSFTNFAVTMWVKPSPGSLATMGNPRLFVIGTNTTTDMGQANTLGIQGNGNINSLQISAGALGNTAVSGLSNLVAGQWNFIAYTYDGLTVRLYSASETNSVISGGSLASVNRIVNLGNRFTLTLGNRLSDRLRGFQGYLDDVRFYTNVVADTNFLENIRKEAAPVLVAGDTIISPTNTVFDGTPVTLSAPVLGTQPISYFWQQFDGVSTWTNLPSSVTNSYAINTTGKNGTTNQYRLVVTNSIGAFTNAPATLIVTPPSAPLLVANTVVSPSSTFAGNIVNVTASFTGSSPFSYQWQFSDLSTFTNNIAGATNSTYTISDAVVANTGSYRVIVTNVVGSSNSAFASLIVTNSSVAVQVLNLGATTPLSSGFDIAQLSSVGNQKFPSGGLNYYSDNAATAACGQSFTTGTNADGYLLSSVYIQWGSIEGAHVAANPYTLCIYSVSGTAVTLLQTYTNQNSAPAMAVGNWTKWIGLSNVLAPNATYAYSIRARSVANTGSGFMQIGNATNNPYAGGMVGLFPSATGTANFGNSADDATFLIHLGSAPPSAPVIQSVNIAPANSVANPVYVGSPVTLSTVAIGSSPKAYQWLSDNGTAGVTFTPISGATSNPYVLDTSSLTAGTQYQYQVIVTNVAGSATSSVVTLDLTNASGPIVVTGVTITPSVVIIGNNVQMSGSFKGSLPITYQWQHAGTNIPGAISNSFAITGAQFTDAGMYSLVASNNPPGIGPITASSTAPLYVVNPPQTNNANASIADGGTSPFVGAYDVSQLSFDPSTPVPAINYYVDNSAPPGQTFKTGSTPPSPAGYPLNYFYFKHDLTGGGAGNLTAQTYTLRVYQMLDGTNTQLLTTYVTTNTTIIANNNWVRVDGLTNVLQTNASYAVSLARNTSGFWKLAAHVSFPDAYPDGAAVSLPVLGGATRFSSDTNFGYFYDAAFVAGMTPATAPTELTPMTINPSTIHTGQGPVVMTASFIGSQPITYQWQHAGTNIPGATATTYTIPVVSVAHDGTYVCLASNNYSLGTPTSSTSQYLTVDPTVQTGLINSTTRNGSFELVSGSPGGTAKVNISTGTVDNWKTWPAFPNSGDTGADDGAEATDGTRYGFLQGDSGIYNIAGHIITAGDVFTYNWDWVLAGRGSAVVQLGYWSGTNVVLIPGTDSTAPGGTGVLLGLGTNYTVMAGDPAIGKPVVLTVNAPAGANYPEVDHVILTVVPAGSTTAPFIVSDTVITPARAFAGASVSMSATFNGTAPISYQWSFDNGGGAVPIAGATNSTYTIASVSLANSGAYYLTASNAYAPYTASSSPKSLQVFSTPQNNTSGAGILDATSVAPTAGPNDIAQLVTAFPTTVPGINYYVDNFSPPGQTFTTLGAFTNGYQLHSIYMQEHNNSDGGGGLNPGIYRLGIYAISDTNAVLLTSYDSTNQPTLINGNWIQWVGLTNVLATNQTYAFSMQKQTGGGYWKLANNATANDLYSGGRAALLPNSGLGALAFSTDTTIDAGFLIALSDVSTVATNPTNIVTSVSGNNLTLSWPVDHTGWRLQSQTNALSVGLTTNWVDVAGANTTNQITIPIGSTNGSVFFRLVYP
jgi:hypothetical protein